MKQEIRNGQRLRNILSGHIFNYRYIRKKYPKCNISSEDRWIIYNVNIIDVDKGVIFKEKAILISGDRIDKRLSAEEFNSEKYSDIGILNGEDKFLIPGLSDIHCHLSLITEYEMKMRDTYYFDAQWERNCENAISRGCTFVRDSLGGYKTLKKLEREITCGRLIGPKIFQSFRAMTPKGGMWDYGRIPLALYSLLLGGTGISVIKSTHDIHRHFYKMQEQKSNSIKIYLEERSLYGSNPERLFNQFSKQDLDEIVLMANSENKVIEAHAMFKSGVNKAIESKVTSIAHLPVDGFYTSEDTNKMVENDVSIVPTMGIGSYLAMNFKNHESHKNDDYIFFRHMLEKYVKPAIESAVIDELKETHKKFFNFIWDKKEARSMPMVGQIDPDTIYGYQKYARKSFENFIKSGVKIGMGSDGGTGLTFSGDLRQEFEMYKYFGMSEKEVLRCATLGNMEILRLDKDYGTLDPGKYADMVLLDKNPLHDITAISSICKVFKNGKLIIDNN